MPDARRDAKLSIRLRRRERRLLELAAEERGEHLSEFVRRAGLQEAREEVRRLHQGIESEAGAP